MRCGQSYASAGLEASARALEDYSQVATAIVPWERMEADVNSLRRYRNGYSSRAEAHVKEITSSLQSGKDYYLGANQTVYDWCQKIVPLLFSLLNILEESSYSSTRQKRIIMQILNEGVEKLNAAKDLLDLSSQHLNQAIGKFVKLETQFQKDKEHFSQHVQKNIKNTRKEYKKTFFEYLIAGPVGLLVSAFDVAEGEISTVPKLKKHLQTIQRNHEMLQRATTTLANQIQHACHSIDEDKRAVAALSSKTHESTVWFEDGMEAVQQELVRASKELINKCSAFINRNDQ